MEAQGQAKLRRPGRLSEHRAYPGVASAFKETPSGLGRTTVPGRLVLRHRTGYRPCRLGGLFEGLVIPRPDGRQMHGLSCGNWSASGKGVLAWPDCDASEETCNLFKTKEGAGNCQA